MSRRLPIALTVAASMLLSTSAFAQSQSFDFTGFDRIDIATGLDVRVTPGDGFSIAASSRSQDALDHLELAVEGNVLSARVEQSFLDFIISGGLVGQLFNGGNAITLDITMPDLAGITASSGADVDIAALTSPRLELDASSGADISLTDAVLGEAILSSSSGSDIAIAGTAASIAANASSGSDINAGDLVARHAVARASSGANITVHASDSVRAEASSGGDVAVRGNPATRDIDESSGGGVHFGN
jgi:hypothetical protein